MNITMCGGDFAVTERDILLRSANSNSIMRGLVHYFSRQTLFQLQYFVVDHLFKAKVYICE